MSTDKYIKRFVYKPKKIYRPSLYKNLIISNSINGTFDGEYVSVKYQPSSFNGISDPLKPQWEGINGKHYIIWIQNYGWCVWFSDNIFALVHSYSEGDDLATPTPRPIGVEYPWQVPIWYATNQSTDSGLTINLK